MLYLITKKVPKTLNVLSAYIFQYHLLAVANVKKFYVKNVLTNGVRIIVHIVNLLVNLKKLTEYF